MKSKFTQLYLQPLTDYLQEIIGNYLEVSTSNTCFWRSQLLHCLGCTSHCFFFKWSSNHIVKYCCGPKIQALWTQHAAIVHVAKVGPKMRRKKKRRRKSRKKKRRKHRKGGLNQLSKRLLMMIDWWLMMIDENWYDYLSKIIDFFTPPLLNFQNFQNFHIC